MSLKYIDEEVNHALKKSLKSNGNGNLVIKLHNEIDTRLNSLNMIIGKPSSGKTVFAMQEIIKLSHLEKTSEKIHLLIYVTKDGSESDVSFNALKHLLNIPYIVVSEADAESTVKLIVSAKNLYRVVKNEGIEDKIEEQQKQDLFDTLHINDFKYNYLHSIILFDDIANSVLFKKPDSYFSQFVKRLRHYNFIVFQLFQGWKNMYNHVKNEISSLIIFPFFNNQQLYHIYTQSSSNLPYDEFKKLYYKLNDYKKFNQDKYVHLLVDTIAGETLIRGI